MFVRHKAGPVRRGERHNL